MAEYTSFQKAIGKSLFEVKKVPEEVTKVALGVLDPNGKAVQFKSGKIKVPIAITETEEFKLFLETKRKYSKQMYAAGFSLDRDRDGEVRGHCLWFEAGQVPEEFVEKIVPKEKPTFQKNAWD